VSGSRPSIGGPVVAELTAAKLVSSRTKVQSIRPPTSVCLIEPSVLRDPVEVERLDVARLEREALRRQRVLDLLAAVPFPPHVAVGELLRLVRRRHRW
jgi:hypothetical protein